MLNYMKSEWYRQRNNRGLQNTILVCLGLIILMVAVLAFFGRRPGFDYANTYFAFNGIFTSMSGIFPSHWFLPALWRITPAIDSLP